ncbi:ferredoxin reductase family protein [Thalassovita gelatinovora]|uniref:ferredoxin reductase family protein n=1 Tax=Thalassovita gelatinovora TaxID=53501 RepID=UPI001F2F2A78|nr:ferric reductase-like transmembrane domain-containing protein [Thalassovita gelatinovora]
MFWLAATLPFPDTLSFIAIRNLLVQYTGVLTIGAMSVIMILATRANWIEPWLNGLDKSYRLHKWLGIGVLVTVFAHWIASGLPKWLVDWGMMEAPQRGTPGAGAPELTGIEGFFREYRGVMEFVGEKAFYLAVILIAVALIKRIRYKTFFSTHKFIAIAYLAGAAHAVTMLTFDHWATPLGIVMALLMLGGTYSAILTLTRQIGRGHKVSGKVGSIQTYPELRATEVNIALEGGWKGHDAGQFAFVTFDPKEGKHPFTIASAWDVATGQITFISKSLGDYTDLLPDTLKVGGMATVEGPYGRFTFEDANTRQIWIGGGIGITPFIAKMKQLATTPGTKTIDLIHTTKEHSADALKRLQADADAAGITLHVLVDDRDGFLSGERIRAMVPDWKAASVWFCGPAGFGQALRADLAANGLAASDFHQELFNMR